MEKRISKLTAARDELVRRLVAKGKRIPELRDPDPGSYLRTWLRLHLDIIRLRVKLWRDK
jgi:hypothetical protein